jgi:hypothetical protein
VLLYFHFSYHQLLVGRRKEIAGERGEYQWRERGEKDKKRRDSREEEKEKKK